MRRLKKLALALLIALLATASWYVFSRLEHIAAPISVTQTNSAPGQVMAHRLRVAAYNIAHGRGGELGASNWNNDTREELLAKLDKIAEQINQVNPDLIVLNEIDFSASWSFGINQAKYLAEKCGYRYVLQQRNYGVSLPFYSVHFGNALLSKFPIEAVEHINFAPYSAQESIFAGNHNGFICEVVLPQQRVAIVGVHLDYRDEPTRIKAVRKIDQVSATRNIPVIALGDFNSSPDGMQDTDEGENAVRILLASGFIASLPDYTQSPTFPSEDPTRKIDWILGRGITGFNNAKVIPSVNSDHLMIVAEAMLPIPTSTTE